MTSIGRRTKGQQKAMGALEEALDGLPDEYLQCRDLRHSWKILNDFYLYERLITSKSIRIPRGSLVIARDLECDRCGVPRREVFVERKWGIEKVRNSYIYPDNYRIHGAAPGVTPSQVINNVQYRKAKDRITEQAKQRQAS